MDRQNFYIKFFYYFKGVLGIFFFIESAGLFPDLGSVGEHVQEQGGLQNVRVKYHSLAYNCWIAAGGYVVTLVIALWQNKWNNRLSS